MAQPAVAAGDIWNTEYKKVEQSIRVPQFSEKTYLITKYGAKTTASAAQNQKAINKAIDKCSKKGGGKVVIPAGEWKTGAIRLKSGVNLVAEKGATILFSDDKSLYPLVETSWEGLDLWNYSPLIYAYQEKDIAITGEGVFDGCASRTAWWPMCGAPRFGYNDQTSESQSRGSRNQLLKMSDNGTPISERKFGPGCGLRPQFVNFNQCDGILIEGVTFLNSPFWVLHPLKSKSVIVRNVRVDNDGPNGDGCDPESCDGVLIEGCHFNTGDDCIAIKSGRNADGRRRNMASQNMIIRRCKMENGHGGVVIGSEVSGGTRNIFVEDCDMDSPNLDRVIRLKTNTCRGGVTDGIYVRNIRVGQCGESVLKINLVYEPNEQAQRGFIPTVKNVYLENVNCNKSRYGVYIDGLKESCNVQNIQIKNCKWEGVAEKGNLLRGQMENVKFDNVTINGSLVLNKGEKPYKHYSEWMTYSEIKRIPNSWMQDFGKKPNWSYAAGMELETMLDTYERYGGEEIWKYLQAFPANMIDEQGNTIGYKYEAFNLDNIRPGRFIFKMYMKDPRKGELEALKTYFKQLENQPRTKDGPFWHKAIYAHQVWLDGIYMGLPFYTLSAPVLKGKKNAVKYWNDAVDQIIMTGKRTYDEKTGLWKHAWDENHDVFWANKETGLCKHSWARAMGWYVMAMLEVLDALPQDFQRRGEVIELFQKAMAAVVKYQDKKSQVWYDVLDVKDPRNYLESSASSMFTFALLKGARLGYLDSKYLEIGKKAYNGLIKNFIKVNPDKTISITNCCSVSGLGPGPNEYVKTPNYKRDGSFEYYMSEKVRDNDNKSVGPFIWASLEMEAMGYDTDMTAVDREVIFDRNNPIITQPDPLASLTVGNGKFATTVDVTGLQSYPDYYKTGIPLCAQSDWGWHFFVNASNVAEAETQDLVDTGHGKGIYAVEKKQKNGASPRQIAATSYFRENPHRLNLGSVGLELKDKEGKIVPITELKNIYQIQRLWEGRIESRFEVEETPVEVFTLCHPEKDCITGLVLTKLFSKGQANLSFRYSYPTGKHSDDANDWEKADAHSTVIKEQGKKYAILERTLDNTKYFVRIDWEGDAEFAEAGKHYFTLKTNDNAIVYSCTYSNEIINEPAMAYKHVISKVAGAWRAYWEKSGVVDFSLCTDKRAKELERRTVLSQYIKAVQCRGSMPPQESGLTYNTWFGRPHLEMAWWHLLDFSLWGHKEVLEKAMTWYDEVAAPKAIEIAKRQGYKGLRWMKMTDPWAGEAPSNVGSFLIWQQPHYIYFAEELYRQAENPAEVLTKYGKNVQLTAEFIADFLTFNKATKKYEVRGATAMQESMSWKMAYNQPFDLAYCHYALNTAQNWRKRQGLEPDAQWKKMIDNMSTLPELNGVYTAGAPVKGYQPETSTTGTDAEFAKMSFEKATRSDHPAVLGACGCLPESYLYDKTKMKATLDDVVSNWNWLTTWGWDYGMMAMAATRLSQPETALKVLLVDTQKNTYLKNGHNYQDGRLRVYLPGNGALLETVAMMCTYNGFPKDGTWNVRWEGLNKMQ